ncbi:hypothetical protein W5O_03245 [Candida albicans Ca6]|nr:hypothetical protein W5O_03245 [Candida albicans Ca6]
MSSDKPEQEILDPKDSKNASLNSTTKKSQDSKLMLPPLGVKSEQQQQQQQQQTPLYGQQGSPQVQTQPQFQADYSYANYQPQAQFYDPYQRQVIMQQANFASPSQYPIQQPYSFANGMTNMAQFHPQTLTSHSDFDQQQMQQSTQPSQQVQVQVQIQPQSNSNSFPAEQKRGRRFRRRFNQIERKYPCSFPGCQKSYGSLNHLNTHIVTKKHGHRKSKADFQHSLQSKEENKPSEISQYVQPSNDYTAGNYWYGYAPHLRSTTSTTSSQSDSFNSQQIPQQPQQQQQQQQPQQQNNSNNYLYYQGFQQPITNATTVSGATSATSTLTPAGTASASLSHQPQIQNPASASTVPQQRMVMGNMGYYQQQGAPQYFPAPQQSLLGINDVDSRNQIDDNKPTQPGI